MANTTTAATNIMAQIMPTIRNFNLADFLGTVSRIIPNGVESITNGISSFVLINTEKYTNFVSTLEEGDSLALQLLGLAAYKLYDSRSVFLMYLHIILAAVFPIFIGSFSSLGRPSSAAKPEKKAPTEGEDEDEFEAELPEKAMETLDKFDALTFPIIAGVMLTGLYFLIKWLEDPAILNKLMGWYFSLIGVGAVGKLATDTLNCLTTFVFPSKWYSRGQTYRIDPVLSRQFVVPGGQTGPAADSKYASIAQDSPIPDPLFLNSKLPWIYSPQLWNLRALLTERWLLKGYVQGIFSFKTHLGLNDILGPIIGAGVISLWNLKGGWLTTNLMGWGVCYTGFQYMSPTTFSTGTLLLTGLFFYDITMVFYTPMMVKVATSLDVPIKLVFPGPGGGAKGGSMLGLGDIVLPGIMIAMCLRFDLYLYYLRKQSKNSQGQTNKAPYVDVSGQWGNWFWTSGAPAAHCPETFSKVYFTASLVGYISGLIVTLVFLKIFNHAQPALLYLVPGVLLAIWGTALVRRELSLIMNYSEESIITSPTDTETDKTKSKDSSSQNPPPKDSTFNEKENLAPTKKLKSEILGIEKAKVKEDEPRYIFMFSLTRPKKKSVPGVPAQVT